MTNNAPIVPCPRCEQPMRLNLHPRHLPVCVGTSPTLADLHRIGKVDDSGDCHVWQNKRQEHGYGLVSPAAAKQIGEWRAHRAAWKLVNGLIPDGMNVLHTCDNPPCIKIEHLYIGTQKDNARDMTERDRHRGRFQPAPLEDRTCPVCGTTFQRKPWQKTRTCSLSCAGTLAWTTTPRPDRNMKKTAVERTCPHCGRTFTLQKPSSRKKTCGDSVCRGKQIWSARR